MTTEITAEDFRQALHRRFANAETVGRQWVDITSGELHREVGGYPAQNHSMPNCCNVMKQETHVGDEILETPPSGMGATLKIRYRIPRPL